MRTLRVLAWSGILLLALVIGLSWGAGAITWSDLLSEDPQGKLSRILFWQLRLPRVVAAAAVGGGLALVGAVLQTLLRNALADPFLIGVSSASATGAVLALATGMAVWRFPCAILAAAISLFFLDRVAYRRQRFSDHHLLVAGVALTYLFSSLTGLVVMLAPADVTRGLLFWLMGGFAERQPLGTWLCLAALLLSMIFLMLRASDLDRLALGDEASHVLGLRPDRLRRQLFLVSSCLVGLAVATAGGIGFVGVLVPHFARMSCGVRHRDVIMLSCIGGAALTVCSDTLARAVFSPKEIPVGLITALLGAPFFLYQLSKGRDG